MKTRYWLMLLTACLAAFCFVVYRDFDLAGCGADIYKTLLSPDGRSTAISYNFDCGATTGFSTQLSILPAKALFDRDKYPPVLILDNKWDLNMQWNDNASLHVAIPKSVHVYKKEDRSGTISVIYD